MGMVNIGEKIKEVLISKHIAVTEFAQKINTNRNNVYHIFKRKTIDTDLLVKISEILQFNFFIYFTEGFENKTINKTEDIAILKKHILTLENEITYLKERLNDKDKIISLLEIKAKVKPNKNQR